MKFYRKIFSILNYSKDVNSAYISFMFMYIFLVLFPPILFYEFIIKPNFGENLIGAGFVILWIYFATKSIFKIDK